MVILLSYAACLKLNVDILPVSMASLVLKIAISAESVGNLHLKLVIVSADAVFPSLSLFLEVLSISGVAR